MKISPEGVPGHSDEFRKYADPLKARLNRNDNLDALNIDKISILDPFIKRFIRETLDVGGIAEIAFNDEKAD